MLFINNFSTRSFINNNLRWDFGSGSSLRAAANSAPWWSGSLSGQLGDFLGGSCGGGFQCDQPQFSPLDVWTGSQWLLSLHGHGTRDTENAENTVPEPGPWGVRLRRGGSEAAAAAGWRFESQRESAEPRSCWAELWPAEEIHVSPRQGTDPVEAGRTWVEAVEAE